MDKALFKKELFTLGRTMHVLVKESVTPIIASKGITQHQLHILLALDIHPGMTAGKLSDEIGIRKTNFAQVLRHLTSAGYVEVRHCTGDKRALQAFLTKKGRALLREIQKEADKAYDPLILDKDEEDIQTILRGVETLKKLLATMESRRCTCSDTSTQTSKH